ncbi:MAG: helix-turn-helix transcriptional regulator [Treponema sp.]|jgi:DNA-binding CsgD family transcriptional regulator|nr:helix-turn-helix transcriptional regulator [Treponema sp.]
MLIDLIFVTLSISLLTALTARKTEILSCFARNSLVAGTLISAVKLMIMVSNLEAASSEELTIIKLLVMILVCLRPILIGVIYRFIFWIVERVFDKNYNDENILAASTALVNAKHFDLSALSRREIEVARLAAKGYTNAQIAETLFVSTETVKRHMSSIFEKLKINSRKQLML